MPWFFRDCYCLLHIFSGMPHIGHAYESLTADVLARWHRVYGRRVFSMTGTDEHGQKIANAAEQQGIQPIDICNK